MSEIEGVRPIADDEILYRRVPKAFYSQTNGVLLEAFLPTSADTDGLSLSRGCVEPAAVAATGRIGKEFYVVSIRANDFPAGLAIHPDSNEHAVVKELTYAARQSDVASTRSQVRQWAEEIRQRASTPMGPFPGEQSGVAP